MSFYSQKAIYYFVDQFQYYLLIGYIKTAVVLKHQQFKDNESEEMGLRVSKRQCAGIYDNEKGQNLDKYEGKGEGEDIG